MEIGEVINKIHNADCIEFMKQMPENSVGAIVTDPPAGISFMQESWDTFDHDMFGIEGQEGENDLKVKKNFKILPRYNNADLIGFQDFICKVFIEAIRVLKPGGYALVWAIPRTSHHTAMGLERAGFEIRNKIYHLYGSGFPKSLNVEKQLLKICQDEKAKEFAGFGTDLKPACEEWILVRKPLSEDSVVENVLKYGTGGINIDASRIGHNEPVKETHRQPRDTTKLKYGFDSTKDNMASAAPEGRFPANVILQCICDTLIVNGKPLKSKNPDEVKGGIWKPSEGKPAGPTYEGGIVLHTNPDCPCYMLDVQSGVLTSGYMSPDLHKRTETQGEYQSPAGIYGKFNNQYLLETYGDTGGASRFFYQAKAAQNEKWFYCKICEKAFCSDDKEQHIHQEPGKTKSYTKNRRCLKCGRQEVSGSPCQCEDPEWEAIERPIAECQIWHPTQKPVQLMEYLIKLITPPAEIVLDPFCGTGTTAVAAEKLGFKWITIDKDPIYVKIAQARLDKYNQQGRLF